MSADPYPIIANLNPVPQKQKKKFLKFAIIPLLVVLIMGGWYLIQNKLWQRSFVKEDPTATQSAQTKHGVWVGFFEFDTTTRRAQLKGQEVSDMHLLAPVVTEKPEVSEGEWVFKVTTTDKEGKVLYISYRVVSIHQSAGNPGIWDFGAAVPYAPGVIIRIFDAEENQIYTGNI